MKTTKQNILLNSHIREFLDFIISSHNLVIGQYFSQITVDKSFFMLAATGIGETVALPVYMLYLLVEKLENDTNHIDIMPTV